MIVLVIRTWCKSSTWATWVLTFFRYWNGFCGYPYAPYVRSKLFTLISNLLLITLTVRDQARTY
jgi:hypothetical protein